jgi:tripartite-type tricarboxylate transporter receptor subunit TctC
MISLNAAMTRRALTALAAGLALFATPWTAADAQDRYPSRTISIVVPYPPGGLADLTARPLAAALERELKQTVIVVNKPGAAAGIGIQSVTNGPADGYTLLVSLVNVSTLPAIAAATGKPAMFQRNQLAGLARLVADPCVIYVQNSAPWKTFAELIADAKKRPDGITYSSSGPYGPTHLPTEMLTQATGTKMRHVPTNGGAPALNLLVGGHVDLFFTVPALAQQFVDAGKLRGLAGSGTARIATSPAIPTLKELGVDLEYAVWVGAFINSKVPAGIRKTLDDAISKIAADPAFQAAIKKTGSTFAYQNAADFTAWWDKDSANIEAIIKKVAANAPK